MRRPPAPAPGGWAALAAPAAAQECRLALVLALDVSSSVDASEDRLQREGLAQALLPPEVGGPSWRATRWRSTSSSGRGQHAQATLLPGWTMVRDARRTSARSRRRSRGAGGAGRTCPPRVGAALGHAATSCATGRTAARRTVDVAGDGIHNEGFAPGPPTRSSRSTA